MIDKPLIKKMFYRLLAPRCFWILSILILPFFDARAQEELLKVIPSSPTVASLAKYGDIPVSYYTGTPNISIPLYEINTGDFTLPIRLSYHASGIKVEEIASWVGLGWSLHAGGIISRAVRGLPDEEGGGYMVETVSTVENILQMPIAERENFLQLLAQGSLLIDLEPDLFTYNFGNHSGKFYYDQVSGEIITLPRVPFRIDKEYFLNTGEWKITTEDGTTYFFGKYEQNTSQMQCDGIGGPVAPVVVTGWFLTKIVTAIGQNEIIFNYVPVNYTIKNITTHTVQATNLQLECGQFLKVCESQNEYQGYRLESISYNQGLIKFNANTNRLDLPGDKRLDDIEIYNFSENIPYKKFIFSYDYFNSNVLDQGDIPPAEKPYWLRLKLVAVQEIAANGENLPPYTFDYEQPNHLPSRLSYAQDHWGYYNGKNTNPHLVPKESNPIAAIGGGADRTVGIEFAKIGVLKKITYPTQGWTDFIYTNHGVYGYVPFSDGLDWVGKGAFLDFSDLKEEPAVFWDTLVIDDKNNRGVYLDINIDGITCPYCPEATTCAVMWIESAENPGQFNLPIICDIEGVFIPNGKYVVRAVFNDNPDPQSYQDFVIQVFWYESVIPASQIEENKVGGLRISEIINNDGNGNVARKIFQYTNAATGKSSGSLVTSFPIYDYYLPCSIGDQGSHLVYYRTSQSNYQPGLTQGSHVGYEEVTVIEADDLTENGKTVYYYSCPRDFQDRLFFGNWDAFGVTGIETMAYPFAPPCSMDHRRGLLRRTDHYKKTDQGFVLIKSIENEYEPLDQGFDDFDATTLANTARGIKAAPYGKSNNGVFAVWALYEVVSEWVRPVRTIEREYPENSDPIEKITIYRYENTGHMQPSGISITRSDGAESRTYIKYPLDFNLPGVPPVGSAASIKNLQDRHFINTEIEKVTTIKDGTTEKLVGAVYKTFEPNVLLPESVYTLPASHDKTLQEYTFSSIGSNGELVMDAGLTPRLLFTAYDNKGNLLAQRKKDDVIMSYQWGYDGNYPVAEVTGADHNAFFYTSFEEFPSGNLSSAKTGKKSFEGPYQVHIPFTGDFRLTYWKKPVSGGAWELVSLVVDEDITIGEPGYLIDEVRLYPVTARMKTYTYFPGIGMSSFTDENNITYYYEYDSFGRLRHIKNQDKQILQDFRYRYKEPQ